MRKLEITIAKILPDQKKNNRKRREWQQEEMAHKDIVLSQRIERN